MRMHDFHTTRKMAAFNRLMKAKCEFFVLFQNVRTIAATTETSFSVFPNSFSKNKYLVGI